MNRFYVITNVEKDKDLKTTRQIYDYLKAWEKLFSGVKAYKQWSEGNMLEKKPEEKKKPEKMEIIATQTPP